MSSHADSPRHKRKQGRPCSLPICETSHVVHFVHLPSFCPPMSMHTRMSLSPMAMAHTQLLMQMIVTMVAAIHAHAHAHAHAQVGDVVTLQLCPAVCGFTCSSAKSPKCFHVNSQFCAAPQSQNLLSGSFGIIADVQRHRAFRWSVGGLALLHGFIFSARPALRADSLSLHTQQREGALYSKDHGSRDTSVQGLVVFHLLDTHACIPTPNIKTRLSLMDLSHVFHPLRSISLG